MYIADLFNKNNLFQHYGGWFRENKVSFFSGLMSSGNRNFSVAWDKWKLNVQVFETLLGFATTAILNLNQIKLLEQKCIQQFRELKDQLSLKENRIIFWSHKLVNLLSKISPTINAITFMENLLLGLISNKIGQPLPRHLFILIKNGSESYKLLPVEIWYRLDKYWRETGKYIRAYKNLNRFLFSLTTHAYLEVNPKEKILILLPDNPEIEIDYKFKYELQMDAIRFLETAFDNFHNLTEDIAKYFGYEPTMILQGWSFIEYKYLPGKQGTVAVVIKDPEQVKAIEVVKEGGRPFFYKVSSPLADDDDEE